MKPAGSLQKLVALDCEMIYTTAGLELAQVTVLDVNGQILLAEYVKPSHGILDYNTRSV